MKRIISLFILGFSITAMGFAQTDLQPVAIVSLTRSEPITVRQLRTQCEVLAWQNLVPQLVRIPTTAEISGFVQQLNRDQRRQILDVMINERLALQAAERDRITVTENELNQHISPLRAQLAQMLGRPATEEEFAQQVRNEFGMDLPAFRENLRRQLITRKYLMFKKEDLINSIRPPTEAEIVREFNISRSELVQPDTVRIHMIQVPYGPDTASRNRARDLTQRLSNEIGTDPARFDAVALRAQTPNSGFQANDIGYVPFNAQARMAMGQDFLDVAFNLRQGEVSRTIEGQQGFQIIKVTENHSMKHLGLDDLILDNSGMTVRQFLTQVMSAQREQEIFARAQQELVIELRAGNPFQIMENNLSGW